MKKYEVFQLNITDKVVEDCNKYGHDGAIKRHDIWEARLDLHLGAQSYTPPMFRFFHKVADISAGCLEDVFRIGNGVMEGNIQRAQEMHSLSVGDIVKDEDGLYHMIDIVGFKRIEVPSSKGLKMKEEHFNTLYEAVNKAYEHNPDAKYRYEHGDFANADRVKDLQRRLCFDTLHLATDQFAPEGFHRELYDYLNDDHIYSALKRMCPVVEMKYDPSAIAKSKAPEETLPSP